MSNVMLLKFYFITICLGRINITMAEGEERKNKFLGQIYFCNYRFSTSNRFTY